MILRSAAEHPVVVVFILHSILQPEREIPLWTVTEVNIFRRIEEVRMQRRT